MTRMTTMTRMTSKVRTTLTTEGNTIKKKARGARRRAREFALQGVYSWIIQGAPDSSQEAGLIDAHIREEPGFDEADFDWYQTLLHGVIKESPALEQHFVGLIDRPLTELSPVERAALLLGTYELVHHTEVPYRATINEAVELAKFFGGAEGFRFVNGVLDRVAAQVRPVEFKAYRARRS